MLCMRRSDKGFTLIEVLAALAVFTAITLGLTPLMLSSIRGAAVSRQFAVGKNLVTQAMERARGLPYFESVKGGITTRRDLLDLYYPDLGAGYSANKFTTVCTSTSSTPAPSGPLACPPPNNDGTPRIPVGYTLTITAEFVAPSTGTPTQYTVVAPAAGYDWDNVNTEFAPGLARLTFAGTWSYGGLNKNFTLFSIFGGRQLSREKTRGTSTITFAIDSRVGWEDGGTTGFLTARAGTLDSSVEERAFTVAEHNVEAGNVQLVTDPTGSTDGFTIEQIFGARASLHAPPSIATAPQETGSPGLVVHPSLSLLSGFLGDTTGNRSSGNAHVTVINEQASSENDFEYPGGAGAEIFWVRAQGVNPSLLLDPTRPSVEVVSGPSSERMRGHTTGLSNPLVPTTTRKVEMTAHIEIPEIRLLPTAFASEGIVKITNFTADVSCMARGSAGAQAVVGNYSAEISYYVDDNGNGLSDGTYSLPETISRNVAGTGDNPLPGIKAPNGGAGPPVFDNPTGPDVHLFESGSTPGYFTDMTAATNIQSASSIERVTVTLPQALTFTTVPLAPGTPNSELFLRVGALSCQAVDKRG